MKKNKSVIGRAVVGGLLFGALGAVVGGISGTGSIKTSIKRQMKSLPNTNQAFLLPNTDQALLFLLLMKLES